MDYLINPLLELSEYKSIIDSIKEYSTPISISGPSDSQKAHISYSICEHTHSTGIFIAYNEMQARKMFEDFSYFYGDDVVFFPSKEIMLHDVEAKSNDAVFQRLNAIDRIIEGKFRFIITSSEAIAQKLISKEVFAGSCIKLILGGKVNLPILSKKLVEIGYERVSVVEGKGQFSVRGGIVDIYSVCNENAVRIELFDDEVDSIRTFDLLTQRSIDKLEEIRIIPAREVIYKFENLEVIIGKIENDLEQYIKKINTKSNTEHINHIKTKVSADIERMKSQNYFPGLDKYIPYIIDNPSYLIDYAGGSVTFMDEPARFEQRIENIELEHYETCKGLMEKRQVLPSSVEIFFQPQEIKNRLQKVKQIYLQTILTENKKLLISKNFSVASKSMNSYQGNFNLLFEDIKEWRNKKCRVIILAGPKGRGEIRFTLHPTNALSPTIVLFFFFPS